MKFTLDSTVGEILKDTQAVEILEGFIPGISTTPMLEFAKDMTLRSLLELPQAEQFGITEEMVNQVLEQINARI